MPRCLASGLPQAWQVGCHRPVNEALLAKCTQQCVIVHALQQVPVKLGSGSYGYQRKLEIVRMSVERRIHLQLQIASLHHLELVGHAQHTSAVSIESVMRHLRHPKQILAAPLPLTCLL
jgi:hypothetical protein